MKSERRRILFIQLPQTDNDPANISENPMLAANYLRYSARRAHESGFFMFSVLPSAANSMDNANLIQSILKKQPDIICVTLYVWNIERSLRILEPIKKANPRLRVIAGGPEVARNHPFLFKTDIIDTAVIGEGESVFPHILRAINLLGKYPIKLTIDIMCGLPGQTIFDIGTAIKWANKQKHAHIQLLHTLLLPGTVLRSQKKQFHLAAQTYPPYRVTKTKTMTKNDFARAEIILEKETECRLDNPTHRFIGSSLPDLFEERIVLQLHKTQKHIPGKHNRRALLIKDNDFLKSMPRLLDVIKTAVIKEPDILWQFVLCPVYEEPLDIFDAMIAVLEQAPHHFIDRLRARANKQNRSARRVMVLLSRHRHYNQSWINAVNSLLSARFY